MEKIKIKKVVHTSAAHTDDKKKMLQPKKDQYTNWSVAIFEKQRPHLVAFLKSNVIPLVDSNECKRILFYAPVKSGKREIPEYLSMRDVDNVQRRQHFFISAFHRCADESQRGELSMHGLSVHSLTKGKKANQCITSIEKSISDGKTIVMHIDECDFGSGAHQVLYKVYKKFHDNDAVTMILYSATPQEVLFSAEVEENEHQEMLDEFIQTGEVAHYKPPLGFCGPKKFLQEGLVVEAIPFFEKEDSGSIKLSEQGREIVKNLRKSTIQNNRNILIIRLSYSLNGGSRKEIKENKAIHQFLKKWNTIPELDGILMYADKTDKDIPESVGVLKEKIQWSDNLYWQAKRVDVPIIAVIDQTSSRSTEWACHDRVYAVHDYRNTVTFSIVSQAVERVNHYDSKYAGFQPILIYAHVKTLELSAGEIDYSSYMNNEWKMKKLDKRTSANINLGDGVYYTIQSTSSLERHPEYPDPLPENECKIVMRDLKCDIEVKVSSRVKGSTRMVKKYNTLFYKCEKNNFDDILAMLKVSFPADHSLHKHNFQNPFIRSEKEGLSDEKYMGQLRGWKVLDYIQDIKPAPGWGVTSDIPRMTICYKNGILGIAVRYDTGMKKETNTMRTFNSMYSK